jgi:hypothetical protein
MAQLTTFDTSISCFFIKNNITTVGFASIIKYNQRTRRVVSNAGTDTVDPAFSPDEGSKVSFRKTIEDRPTSPSTISFPLNVADIGLDNSVGIATRYGLNCPGIESPWGRDFPHPPWGPHKWVPGLFAGGKAAGAWL